MPAPAPALSPYRPAPSPASASPPLAAEPVDLRLFSLQLWLASIAQGSDRFLAETGLARELRMDEPLVLAGPAPRRHQHHQLDELRRQLGFPAQVFAEALDAAREL